MVEAPEVVARTWTDGSEVDCSDDEWAVLRAGFLGCGFRVVVPPGPEQEATLDRARALALAVAERVGARLDEAPWQALAVERPARGTAEVLEVTGGWTHRFRAPLGACSTRVTVLPPRADEASTALRPGMTLPWQVNEHSPLAGLPVLSSHHEARAAQWLDEGTVGVWTNSAGHLVDTTAGTLLLRTPRGWLHPLGTDGAVPHHLWERCCTLLGAVAWRGPAPEDLTAVACVAADGRVTQLSSLDGRDLQGPVGDVPATLLTPTE